MLKPELSSVLWCVNIANFIFIAVKKRHICDEEQDHAPDSGCMGEARAGGSETMVL